MYGLLIVGFAYFYTAIQFDPAQQADTIRRQGGYIPGIRPGPQTERYLGRILNRITLPGSLYLGVISVMPNFFFIWLDASLRKRAEVHDVHVAAVSEDAVAAPSQRLSQRRIER